MPGRGLLPVACLVFIALCCISVVRRLEAERRLLRKLTARGAARAEPVPLDQLAPAEQDAAQSLVKAGVLSIQSGRCWVHAAELSLFRRKRLALALAGGVIALAAAVVVAKLILHR